jgi:hypothetical protein
VAKLSVNNRVFQYKDTAYQISHITSVRVTSYVRKTKSTPPSDESMKKKFRMGKFFVLATLIGVIGKIILSIPGTWIHLAIFVLGAIAFAYFRSAFAEYRKIKYFDPNLRMWKLRVALSSGDVDEFESSREETIMTIREKIEQAMQEGQNSSFSWSMSDVNIEINHSKDINLGSVSR